MNGLASKRNREFALNVKLPIGIGQEGGENMMQKSVPPCPVCWAEKSTYSDLARHIVTSDRPSGPHQQWLQSFLNKEFPQYAFKRDSDVAKALERYCVRNHSWPEDLVRDE